MKQEQRDALFQDLQKKLQKADKLLEQSRDSERLGGIGKYKLCIIIATWFSFTVREDGLLFFHTSVSQFVVNIFLSTLFLIEDIPVCFVN
jgi:hypothetical protein